MIHDFYLFSVSSACFKIFKKFLLGLWLYFGFFFAKFNVTYFVQPDTTYCSPPRKTCCFRVISFHVKSPSSSDQTATAATFKLISSSFLASFLFFCGFLVQLVPSTPLTPVSPSLLAAYWIAFSKERRIRGCETRAMRLLREANVKVWASHTFQPTSARLRCLTAKIKSLALCWVYKSGAALLCMLLRPRTSDAAGFNPVVPPRPASFQPARVLSPAGNDTGVQACLSFLFFFSFCLPPTFMSH